MRTRRVQDETAPSPKFEALCAFLEARADLLEGCSPSMDRAAATICSLIESCKQSGIPADRYFAEVLKRLTKDPKTDPRTLMPCRLPELAEPRRAAAAGTA